MFDKLSEDQRQELNIVREENNLFITGHSDWLGRTIAFYQVFFQQGRVALGKWCIGPQKGHPGFRDGFFLYCAQASFSWPRVDLARLLRRLIFSVCLDYILRVCQSLRDSFLYLGNLHWFLYLLLSYFYDPGMFIFRWSSNFMENVVLNETMSAKWHLVFPTLYIIIVDRMNLNKLLQIITKLRWSNKDNNN